MKKEKVINSTHEEIIQWIKGLKFRRKIFGGVDEADVLKKIEELNSLYETALLNERVRYQALLEQYKGGEAEHEN